MNERLATTLRKLRLSGLAETLEVRLHEASANSLTHAEFLELILQDELLVRQQRQIARRVKAAAFRELKSLEDFDWSFNPAIKKNEMYDLATGRFLNERRDVLLCAPSGTGKSHLVQAVGYHLIKTGHIVLYRSIFDVVRDFLHDEAMDGHERIMASYLKPDLLPVVLGHGRIRLELRPRISEIDADRSVVLGDLTVPGLRVRQVDTGVEMSVGQTFVLAGLVQHRVIHKAIEESGEAEKDKNPGLVPSKTSEGNSGPGQDEIEATELIIMVRAEILDGPKLARRAAVE